MKVITITNQKGGTGKSTTAGTLFAGLKLRGYKVLFIDLDAQGNSSYIMGAQGQTPISINDLIKNPKLDVNKAIEQTAKGDIIHSNPELNLAHLHLKGKDAEQAIKTIIAPLKSKYDFIVIDTPPALSVLTFNALVASDFVVIPAEADLFSLQGISQLFDTIAPIKELLNPKLKVSGILLTRYNERTILSKQITDSIDELAKKHKTKVFRAKIREAVAVKEANTQQENIFSYAPNSNVAQDYKAFIREFLKGI